MLSVGPVDLVIGAGRCAGIRGPSGAGKTLFLRAVADMIEHSGRVSIDGVESLAFSGPQWRRRVGLLPSESAWWFDTVEPHFSASPGEDLALLGFSSDVMRWEVSRLSSGERQRLALLRLLVQEPEAVLLDEPTANLDPDSTRRVESFLSRYRDDSGAAMIWVGHDPVQLRRVADRTFTLSGGKLIREDS